MDEASFGELLCHALRRNEPYPTHLDSVHYRNIPQYGRRLGEALQGNHCVSSMYLDVNSLLGFDNEEGAHNSVALLLRYIRESEAMREVVLRGDGQDGRVELIATTLVPLFLLAIAENPCIVEFNLAMMLNMEPFAEALSLLLRTTRSLKTSSITLGPFQKPASRELVAEAFGANQTLDTLTFTDNSDTDTLEYVLLCLGSHPCLREL